MTVPEPVSVIVPTAAAANRRARLLRALDSILCQEDVRAVPIVVANGSRINKGILDELRQNNNIRLVHIEEASFPLALKTGRNLIDTEFFTELDDDDELFRNALKTRLKALQTDPTADAVVTRGILRGKDTRLNTIDSLDYARKDPLEGILRCNWLYPGSALFRSETIDESFFQDIPAYLEWTYIGILLSLRRNIIFLDDITFFHSIDSDDSIQNTPECIVTRPVAVENLLTLDLPPGARRIIKRKAAAAYHSRSVAELAGENFRSAWSCHLKSLRYWSGVRYLPYTRHLLRLR